MSIGFLKRLLAAAKLVAILSIVGAAYGYWDHHQDITGGWNAPDFRPPVRPTLLKVSATGAIGMQLGRFQEEVPVDANAPVEEPEEEITDALSKLGVITNAIVAYPPYVDARPAITFQFKETPPGSTSNLRTIRLGQALLERPHPVADFAEAGYTVPYRYKFIDCEPDPENPEWTYFVFDMNCDGKDRQKMRWKHEGEKKVEWKAATDGAPEGLKPIVGKGVAVVDRRAREAADRPAETAPETEVVQPPEQVRPAPAPAAFGPTHLFEEENGALAVTDEAAEYLKDNYQNILKDAVTQTYKKDGRASGVRVVNIRAGSMANEFGIYKDDVILSINDVTVTKQSQAVAVVKRELKKKPTPRYLTVRILRRGQTIVKRYDTRDPETRRRARKAFGR
jgi:hypothetical protein